jgi:type IV pilus assembly protein PilE
MHFARMDEQVTQQTTRQRGFTLIELVIAMVVIGILAAISIPSYAAYVQRSNRVATQAFLADLASRQQQYLLNRREYGSLTDLGITVPGDISKSYTVTMTAELPANAPPRFTATATPVGGQAAERCGTLTINSAGQKSPAGCW